MRDRPSELSIEEFAERVREFAEEVKIPADFDSLMELWRSTSLPYKMPDLDPLGSEYRGQVLSLYEKIAGLSYATSNEMTSTLQSEESFSLGYPWVSKNFGVVTDELSKTVQALTALSRVGHHAKFIEFGAGWGNLAIPLVKAGRDVTVVDIDEQFLKRIERILEFDKLSISTVLGDFLDVSQTLQGTFDVIVFQSSFHHCLDFVTMLQSLVRRCLAEDGEVYFFSEPVVDSYPFPWGLRFDGESLWAITCNKWLELGFDRDFFVHMLFSLGLFPSVVQGVSGGVGPAWRAQRIGRGIAFQDWALPSDCDNGFWPAESGSETSRFSRGDSYLPRIALDGFESYELKLANYLSIPLTVSLVGDTDRLEVSLGSNETRTLRAPASTRADLKINSAVGIPAELAGTADTRTLGIAVVHVAVV